MEMLDQYRVQAALELAVKYHAFQYRKEHSTAGHKIPFVVHPMQVMKVVFDWGAGTPDNLAAAACHDILEDTFMKSTPGLLLMEIGPVAYEIVKELTFFEQGEDPRDKQEQKNAYLQTFATKSVNALVIKLADRACNVQDFINGGDPRYAAKYAKKAQPLYDAVLARKDEIKAAFDYDTFRAMRCVVNELGLAYLGE